MNRSPGKAGIWAIWFTSVLVSLSLTKNPAYLIVIVLSVAVVLASKRPEEGVGPWRAFINLGLAFFAISVVYNTLISHHGNTVLFRLPGWIPAIGGPLTMEAAVFGATFGLTFLGGVMAFAVLNAVVGIGEILRLLPARMRGAATVISVAMNFIPSTALAAREITEARTIRRLDYGRGLTGKVRQAGAVFVPLVITGLEKAVVMSESMESRAYGGAKTTAMPARRRSWTAADYATAILSAAPAIILAYMLAAGQGSLAYTPYPTLTLPGFTTAAGLALALLASPAVTT